MITPRVQELLDAVDAGRDSFAGAYDRLKCTSEELHAVLVTIAPGATVEERHRLLRSLGSEDPAAFVVSANIYRRPMSKGQRAMTGAKSYPETSQGKKTSEDFSEVASRRYINMARTVLQFVPDLADGVLTGSTSLDEAYKAARKASGLELSARGEIVMNRKK